MRSFVVYFLVFLMAGLIQGCSEDKPKKLKPVQTRRSAPKQKPEPEAEKKAQPSAPAAKETENAFVYITEGRRDPFASLLVIKEPVEDDKEPLTPLQTFGLKEIRVIAIVIGKGEPRAMVIAPDKKAYTLTSGVKIGRNKGVVQQITPYEIIVEERFRDFAGTTRTEIKRMTLPQGEGE